MESRRFGLLITLRSDARRRYLWWRHGQSRTRQHRVATRRRPAFHRALPAGSRHTGFRGTETMNKKMGLMIAVAAFAGAGLFLWSNSNDGRQPGDQPDATTPQGAAMAKVSLPDSLSEQAKIGERAFNAACAECHGDNAAGRQGMGPPLVHKIYEP